MARRLWLLGVLGLLAMSCGKSAVAGYYKGTLAESQTSGGNTSTRTSTGVGIWIVDTSTANKVVLIQGMEDPGFTATVNGTALNVDPGQSINYVSGSSTTNVAMTSGSGSVNDKSVNMTFAGTVTQTSGGNTQTLTFTNTFTGTRE